VTAERRLGGRRTLLAMAAFTVAAVLFFSHLTLGNQVLFWGMPLLQFYPWRSFAAAEYLNGSVPLWNPYAGFGMPLAANLQSGVFYPLNIVYLFLPIERAQTVSLVLHVTIAGITAYGMCRSLGCSRTAAVSGGFTFMFSGFVVAQGNFHNITSVLAWLPAVIWGSQSVLGAEGPVQRALTVAGMAGATALLLTAGFIQYAYYGLVAAALFVACRLWPWLPQWRRTLGRGLPLAGAVALGVGLAAVQLGPTLELTRHSVRQAGLGFEDATSASLWPGLLLTTVLPGLFGSQPTNDWRAPGTPYEGVLFLGALPLLATLLARRASLPNLRLFAGLAAAGLFLALGKHNPVFHLLFDWVPGLSLFHAPARFGLWYLLGMTVLTAMGVHAVQGGLAQVRGPGSLALAAGLSLAILGAGLSLWGGASPWLLTAGTALAAGGLWLAGAGALLRARARLSGDAWGVAAATFVAANLFALGQGLTPGTDPKLYTAPPPDGIRHLQADADLDRTWTSDAGYLAAQQFYLNFSGFWITEADRLLQMRDQLMPNYGTVLKLHEAHNYDPLKLSRPAVLQGAVQSAGFPPHLLDLMGVRYLPTGSGVAAAGVREYARVGDAAIFARAEPMPRAFVVPSAAHAGTAAEALQAVMDAGFDPRRSAVVEAPEGVALPQSAGDFRSAAIREYAHQRVVLTADGGRAGGVLVLTDAFYPGWRATVNGAETPIYPANLAFRGVLLPPGQHVVEFTYQPMSFVAGLATTGISLLVLTGLLVYGLRPRR